MLLPLEICQEDLEQHLPTHIQYSIQYWLDHYNRSLAITDGWHNDDAKVLTFFKTFLLNWLEALSLIQATAETVRMVTRLHLVMSVSAS